MADAMKLVPVEPTEAMIEAGCRAMHDAQGTGDADAPLHSPYQKSWDDPDSVRWKQWRETVLADVWPAMLAAAPQAPFGGMSVPLPTDLGGCVTKRFVIFTRPGWEPEKKGGWLREEHLIEFLREVMLWQGGHRPGFRATVLELTWNNDIWASSASAYLAEHDDAIGQRRARKAWQKARDQHERIYKISPAMKLGDEIAAYKKATAIEACPAPATADSRP